MGFYFASNLASPFFWGRKKTKHDFLEGILKVNQVNLNFKWFMIFEVSFNCHFTPVTVRSKQLQGCFLGEGDRFHSDRFCGKGLFFFVTCAFGCLGGVFLEDVRRPLGSLVVQLFDRNKKGCPSQPMSAIFQADRNAIYFQREE